MQRCALFILMLLLFTATSALVLCPDERTIFYHVPKAAGFSLGSTLLNAGLNCTVIGGVIAGSVDPMHATPHDLAEWHERGWLLPFTDYHADRHRVPIDGFDPAAALSAAWASFAVVRCPYMRVLSAFEQRVARGHEYQSVWNWCATGTGATSGRGGGSRGKTPLRREPWRGTLAKSLPPPPPTPIKASMPVSRSALPPYPSRFYLAKRYADEGGLAAATTVSTAHQLRLYALAQQATLGDNPSSEPKLLDSAARAKSRAWTELGGQEVSQIECMVRYVNLIEELVAVWWEWEPLELGQPTVTSPATDAAARDATSFPTDAAARDATSFPLHSSPETSPATLIAQAGSHSGELAACVAPPSDFEGFMRWLEQRLDAATWVDEPQLVHFRPASDYTHGLASTERPSVKGRQQILSRILRVESLHDELPRLIDTLLAPRFLHSAPEWSLPHNHAQSAVGDPRRSLCQLPSGCAPHELDALLERTAHTLETIAITNRLYAVGTLVQRL